MKDCHKGETEQVRRVDAKGVYSYAVMVKGVIINTAGTREEQRVLGRCRMERWVYISMFSLLYLLSLRSNRVSASIKNSGSTTL
jgi:hypothetical protein